MPGNNPTNRTAIAALVQTANANATQVSTEPAVPPTVSPTTIPTTPPTIVESVSPTVTRNATSSKGESFERMIKFSGLDWRVKTSGIKVGPGPNYFSNSSENVWVDEIGQLHLKITHQEDQWYCAEVVTAAPVGYGSYQFKIAKGAAGLDKNVVLGLFTWDTTAPKFHYREIDVELSRWNEETNLNAQFVVQPWDRPGNRHRFAIDPQAESSTHIFSWSPEGVQFLSFLGELPSPTPNNIVEQWSYTKKDTPPAGGSVNARINLWLNNGRPPSEGNEIEIVLSSFSFVPQPAIP